MRIKHRCPNCSEYIQDVVVETKSENGLKQKKVPLQYNWFGEDKKPIWKNIFHIDWFVVAIVISILLIIYGAKTTLQDCRTFIEHPCDNLKVYCSSSNQEVQNGNTGTVSPGIIIEDSRES